MRLTQTTQPDPVLTLDEVKQHLASTAQPKMTTLTGL